jgi:Rod binding domain-containing protein
MTATDPMLTRPLNGLPTEKFEASFLSEMIRHMSEGVKTDPLTGGGHGEDNFKSFLNEQYSKAIVARGGIGVADMVYKQMLRMQEGAQ